MTKNLILTYHAIFPHHNFASQSWKLIDERFDSNEMKHHVFACDTRQFT